MGNMTEKQKRFCDEYLIDLNATRAYKVAYPSIKKDRTATSAGNRLLTNVDVKKYIDEKLAEIQSNKIAKAEEVMEYLTAVMRGEHESEIVVVEGCGDGISQAKNVSKKPDEKEMLKAAELLGKRYGLFTDKMQVEGNIPVMIVDDLEDDADD